ncbi:type II secretion system F family protein [Actinospongicola halichondriae]|uniref:type II secretion system F family protein n=1 Tax=Actinospongicola halichondriae TaxID=3236844 RepID=UPI003D485F9F
MVLTLGVLGIVLAVALVALAIGMQLDERAGIRTSLRRVGGYEIQDTRDKELLESFGQRTIVPAFRRLGDLGRQVTPVGYLDNVRKKLQRSGQSDASALDRFVVLKIVGVVLAPVAVFVVFVVLDMGGLMGLLVAGVSAVLLAMGPDLVLDRQVETRVHAMRIALPEVLDLLVISVEAGLGFEQALDRVVDNVPGPLTDEFARMLGEVRAGSSRSEAMRAMEARVDVQEVRSFILAMLQADTFGVSIAKVLRTQADEMRIKRRQLAQEQAQKAPVKMLIPMVFCIFPALFVVVLGPAVFDILDAF